MHLQNSFRLATLVAALLELTYFKNFSVVFMLFFAPEEIHEQFVLCCKYPLKGEGRARRMCSILNIGRDLMIVNFLSKI